MKNTKRSIAMLLVLTLLLFSMTGCSASAAQGEKISGGEAASSGQSQEASASQKEYAALKIGMAGKDIKTVCIIIAKQLGYYEEEGLKVEFETISNLSEGLTAVDMGKLDVLPFGVIPSATFVGQGADVVVFGGTISEGSEIVTLPENAHSIKTLEDFRGKRIGCYRMETGHMVMKGLLREAGFDLEKDVEFVLLDSQQTIIEAVRKGEVDMGFLNSGQGYVAQQAGLAVARRVAEFEADFPCCRQTTSRSALTEKRDALVAFQTANLRAYDTYLNDKTASVAALMEYSGQPEEFVTALLYGLEGEYEKAMIVSLDPNRNKVVDFYQTMIDNGDIAAGNGNDMASHVDSSIYYDALEQLIERGVNPQLYEQLMEDYQRNNL